MIDFTVQQSTHVFRNMDPVVRQELMTYIQEVELAVSTTKDASELYLLV